MTLLPKWPWVESDWVVYYGSIQVVSNGEVIGRMPFVYGVDTSLRILSGKRYGYCFWLHCRSIVVSSYIIFQVGSRQSIKPANGESETTLSYSYLYGEGFKTFSGNIAKGVGK